jgi:iron complex outermembrane receptor protein
VWDLSSTRITLAGDYYDADDDFTYLLLPGSVGLDGVTTYQGYDRASSTYPVEESTELWGGSLTIEHDMNWADLVAITSYRALDGYIAPDNDASAAPILNAAITQDQETYAQEVRLGSKPGSGVQWLVGIYLLHSEGGYIPIELTGAAILPATFLQVDSEQRTISYSAFSQATFPVAENLDLTLGLRYTLDEQKIQYTQATNFGAVSGDDEKNFSEITPRVSVEYQLAEDLLVYASYNKGFKSGLFNTVTPTDPPVKPATVDAYEVGLKSEWLDGRMRFNSSAFFYDQQDLQLLQVQGPLTIVVNAAESEVWGADFEIEYLVTADLSLRAGGTFLDTEYTSYPDAPITTRNPTGGNIITSGDASGNEAVRSPKFQGNLGVTYAFARDWQASINYAYMDSFAWDPDGRLTQPSYHLLNGSLGWTSADGRFGIKAWIRNALDEKYFTFGSATVFGDIANPAEPTTYGISISVKN